MIKYLISLLVGMIVGVVLLLAGLYYNPLTSQNNLTPISVTENEILSLNYSAVAKDALVYTNDGNSQVNPNPGKIQQLWEPTIRLTTAMATVLADSRGEPAGIGIKLSSESERTNILNGEALVDSVWHIYLPERGSLFVEQTENYWSFLRDVVVPAHWSSGDNWRGTWRGNMTSGPGALRTAKVAGGSGKLEGLDAEAVEAWSAKAYSVADGPVAIQGELSIEIPRGDALQSAAAE